MIAAALAAFLAVFAAEFGDKTQLITMTMACRYPALNVAIGALLAMGASMALAVLAGSVIHNLIPHSTVALVAGAIFIISGLYCALRRQETDEAEAVNCPGGLVQTMCLVFLAEIGDKSQLAALMLAAGAGYPAAVYGGALVATLLNILLAVFFGKQVVARLKPAWLKTGTAALFIIIGLVMVLKERF